MHPHPPVLGGSPRQPLLSHCLMSRTTESSSTKAFCTYLKVRQTDGQIDRQSGGWLDRQTDRQTDRQMVSQTDRHHQIDRQRELRIISMHHTHLLSPGCDWRTIVTCRRGIDFYKPGIVLIIHLGERGERGEREERRDGRREWR